MEGNNSATAPAAVVAGDQVAEADQGKPIAPLADFEAAILGKAEPVDLVEVELGKRCGCGYVLALGPHRAGADCIVALREQMIAIVGCLTRAESRQDLQSMLLQCGFELKFRHGS